MNLSWIDFVLSPGILILVGILMITIAIALAANFVSALAFLGLMIFIFGIVLALKP